jgi:phosphoglucomutase
VWLSASSIIVAVVATVVAHYSYLLLQSSSMTTYKCTVVQTTPIPGQEPGTSGLRKKTKEFMSPHYLNNFVQAVFDAVIAGGTNVSDGTLMVGGDGRYYNDIAIQTIIKMGVANGVKRFWIGKDGLLSTPAVSATIRERGPVWQTAFGAFILTASHNPGGPTEDFGIKYNTQNGGPAPEYLMQSTFDNTKSITEYKICTDFPNVDISTVGSTKVGDVVVEVISSTDSHVKLLKTIFDFDAIKTLLDRKDFTMVYDSMHGVNGKKKKRHSLLL